MAYKDQCDIAYKQTTTQTLSQPFSPPNQHGTYSLFTLTFQVLLIY